jgi:polar amino acid transport system ATP-binding protein
VSWNRVLLVAEVLEVMRELAAKGMTLAMVPQEMYFARDVCLRVVFMYDGKVHEIGPPQVVCATLKAPELKQCLGMMASLTRC